jgi:hypothetical protein
MSEIFSISVILDSLQKHPRKASLSGEPERDQEMDNADAKLGQHSEPTSDSV